MTAVIHAEEDRKAKARARKDRQKANKYSKSDGGWRGWVTYPRTKLLKEQCDAFTDDIDLVWDKLNEGLKDGLRVSISYDGREGTFNATYTVKDAERSDSGLGLSAYADDAGEALGRAVFFVMVCGQGKLDHPSFDLPDGPKAKRDFWE